ncbi:MAG: exodeoxyribonuclease III [Pseudomonadota bacterium]
MPRTMRLLSWNVNGIRAVVKKGFLPWIESQSPDFLCLQETKARPEQLTEEVLAPAGYRSFWHSAENKKGYSGVAVYCRTEPERVSTGFGIPRFDVEGRVLELDFKDFVLFNIYFPNGKQNKDRLDFKMDFYDAFLEAAEKHGRAGRSVIFCGDLNTAHNEIDLARPKENENSSGFLRMERDWIDKVTAAGFVDSFRSLHPDEAAYSWWDLKSRARERNVGWRIDYVFVSADFRPRITDAFILTEVMGSDHCPVGVDIAVE